MSVLREMIDDERARDTMKPTEVVLRIKNPPKNNRQPKYQEALRHLERWDFLGRKFHAHGLVTWPQKVVLDRFPGLDQVEYWRKLNPAWTIAFRASEP